MLDLTNEKHAYLIGFLQGDEYHTIQSRNRGKIGIELKKYDKKWQLHEDEYILSHNVSESCKQLNRSESSIKTRLWRLKYEKK